MGSDDNSTILITNIHDALNTSDKEAEEKSACLLVVGGDLNGTLFDLFPGVTTVGRNPDNTIPLEFKGVSRKHFQIEISSQGNDEDNVTIEDLQSSNGTFLNNVHLHEKTTLRKADMIKVGAIAFKYLPKGDPERLAYDKLNLDANTDGLTKCFNKVYFNSATDLEVKKSKITGRPLSLMIFDIDFFKKLNDGYGHDAGDRVLKEMAELIRKQGIREGDIFARYGGEEFVVLLPNTNLKNAFEIAERIRQMVEVHQFKYDNQLLPVRISVGIADYRKGVHNGVDLFKRADQAVYKSKQNGRNQVSFYRE
jgi:diguanylate cyclase (GGDEF)-like protein